MSTETKISSFNTGFRPFTEAAVLGRRLTVIAHAVQENTQCVNSK